MVRSPDRCHLELNVAGFKQGVRTFLATCPEGAAKYNAVIASFGPYQIKIEGTSPRQVLDKMRQDREIVYIKDFYRLPSQGQ